MSARRLEQPAELFAARAVSGRLPTIGVASAHMMSRIAQDYGSPRRRLLGSSGIAHDTLDDPDGSIDITQEIAVARNLVASVRNEPELGLVVGARYHVTMYGHLGWGMLCAPTLRDQIEFAGKFLDLTYTCCEITTREHDGRLRIQVNDAGVPEDIRRFFCDRSLSSIVTLFRDTLPWTGWLHAVNLVRAKPRNSRLYEDLFQAPVSFSQPANELVVNTDRLHLRTPTANELTFAVAQRQCQVLLAQRREGMTLRDRVQQQIMTSLPLAPSINQVATALYLSERTLRRKLILESTSFSDILDDTRRAMAADLLSNGISPSKVATHLGYTTPTSFTHAFQRWYAQGPREFTAQAGGTASGCLSSGRLLPQAVGTDTPKT